MQSHGKNCRYTADRIERLLGKHSPLSVNWLLVIGLEFIYIIIVPQIKEHHKRKRKLGVFEMSVLRKICGITRKDRRRNVYILKELSIGKDIVDLLQVRRLTYFGHVNRMGNDRFPKLLLHGYTHGHRSRGRPKNGWTISVRTVRTRIYLYYNCLLYTSPSPRD